ENLRELIIICLDSFRVRARSRQRFVSSEGFPRLPYLADDSFDGNGAGLFNGFRCLNVNAVRVGRGVTTL
ncbi:MAG: hypothetical protein JSW50_15285, partial [Candidatus Latescibacterota bacterium]